MPETTTQGRARPMGLEARQDMIIGLVTPLLLEHGAAVTSRQIAEATGLAEGTIYRAFGDKESLIDAVLDRYYDPLTVVGALRAIPADLPLRELLLRLLQVTMERIDQVVRMVTAMGGRRPPEVKLPFPDVATELLEAHRDELRIEPSRVVDMIRVLAFASSFPMPGIETKPTPDELTELLMNGVLHH